MSADPSDLFVIRADGVLPTGQTAIVFEGVTGEALRADGDVWALLAESLLMSRFWHTFKQMPDSVYWIVPGGDA